MARLPRRLPAPAHALRRGRARAGLAAVVAVVALGAAAVVLRMLPGVPLDAPRGVPLIVYAEFGSTGDHLYTAPATDPARRTLVDTIEHAEGWGINPGAMRDNRVAFTVLPSGSAGGRGAPAELWLLDIAGKDRTRLARDADLLVKPQLIDANTVIYRRTSGDRQAVVSIDVRQQLRTVVYEERTAFGIFPVGFDATGALLFTRLSTSGTDVLSVQPGEQPVLLFHASDAIARDWQLSPDGRALAFLAPEERGERVVYRAQVVALGGGSGGARAASLPGVAPTGEQYGPTWTPDGRAVAVGREPVQDGAAPVTLLRLAAGGADPPTLAAPPRGFDVPVAWSPGGEYLAARTFDGVDSTNPGRESAVVIGADGARRAIPATGEVILVGWLSSA